MSIYSRDIRKIGIWFLLLAFVFAAIVLPLLSVDAPDAATTPIFTLIFILEVLFAFSIYRHQLDCTAYHFGIRPRGPPNR
jgi:hypothetical protein